MPYFDEMKEQGLPLRILCYGPAKTRKTWWAATAAEAGFNVILVDGDDGYHIVSKISPEARKRILIIDAVDDYRAANMCMFMTLMLKGQPFAWDENSKSMVMLGRDGSPVAPPPNAKIIIVDPGKLTINDVLIFDSWTALVQSLEKRFMIEHKIDLSLKSDVVSNWDGYRWTGMMADWMLQQIKAFPCSIVVIGHANVYEKRKTETDGDGKQRQTVEWARTQVTSTSGPHALKLAKYFSDILFFKLIGPTNYIDARADETRDGGSRLIEPKQYEWRELPFSRLSDGAGIKPDAAQKQTAIVPWTPTLVQPATVTTEQPQRKIQLTPAQPVSEGSGGVLVPPPTTKGPVTLASLLNK